VFLDDYCGKLAPPGEDSEAGVDVGINRNELNGPSCGFPSATGLFEERGRVSRTRGRSGTLKGGILLAWVSAGGTNKGRVYREVCGKGAGTVQVG